MAWNRNVAIWIVLFCCINAALTDIQIDDEKASAERETLIKWCPNQRIIFNTTNDCEYEDSTKMLCSREIVSLYNKEIKSLNNGRLTEMKGDWSKTHLHYTNPYDQCIQSGMIVAGYGINGTEVILDIFRFMSENPNMVFIPSEDGGWEPLQGGCRSMWGHCGLISLILCSFILNIFSHIFRFNSNYFI